MNIRSFICSKQFHIGPSIRIPFVRLIKKWTLQVLVSLAYFNQNFIYKEVS